MAGYVDLHTHSSASDGTDSPAALVAKAAEAGLDAIAVTDHDTLSGLDEAVEAGARHGVVVVRGCELAVSSPFGEVHLVGLWLPERPAALAAALESIRAARDERNRKMVEAFRRAGFDITYDEVLAVAAGKSVGRPHFARLLVRKGICATTREAFATFLGDDKPMFVPRVLPSPEEGMALFRAEGATVVFAHPMLLRASFSALEAMVASFAAMGLDAVEVRHPEHNATAMRRAESLAERYGLGISGGSDYHGSVRPDVRLGRVWGGGRVPRAVMDALLRRRVDKGLPSR